MTVEDVFVLKGQTARNSGSSFYEEPDTPQQVSPLQPAPVLRDITNEYEPPTKVDKLNNLGSPISEEIEDVYGFSLWQSPGKDMLGGRVITLTSKRLQRSRTVAVNVNREFSHYPRPVITRSRGALSQPAPGCISYCQICLGRQAKGLGHERLQKY